MGIIKTINDVIITKNDIISTLVTISVTFSEITNIDTTNLIMGAHKTPRNLNFMMELPQNVVNSNTCYVQHLFNNSIMD